MTRIIGIIGLISVLAGCTAEIHSTSAPGESAVYERIRGLTDCGELQHEFDVAMRNVDRLAPGSSERDVPLSYAESANYRMRDLGCTAP